MGNNIIGKVTVTSSYDITKDIVTDILITAFEGGSNYWIKEVQCRNWPKEAVFASEVPANGGYLDIIVKDTDYPDEIETHQIDLASILEGIRLYCEDREIHPATLFDERHGDYDASDADGILQFACFGELVYG